MVCCLKHVQANKSERHVCLRHGDHKCRFPPSLSLRQCCRRLVVAIVLHNEPRMFLAAPSMFSARLNGCIARRDRSLVRLRPLRFRPAVNQRLSLYNHLSSQTLTTIECGRLHALSHEPSIVDRRMAIDTVADLASKHMERAGPDTLFKRRLSPWRVRTPVFAKQSSKCSLVHSTWT